MTDTDTRLAELEREISGFRRSIRRHRLVGGGMAALLGALVVGGSGQPDDVGKVVDELRVKRLAVVDDEGKTRIVAATIPEGDAFVQWLDPDGKSRIQASALPDGAAAAKWIDRDGKSRINASTSSNGDAYLPTTDLKKKP